MLRVFLFLTVCSLLALLLMTPTNTVRGCAVVYKMVVRDKDVGKVPVEIADESAIIVWDAQKGVEHFIRRASFSTDSVDFGFMVPTPDRPEVKPSSDAAFDQLEKVTAPRVIERVTKVYRRSGHKNLATTGSSVPQRKVEPPVRVLEVGRVGNLDYSILEASDPEALTKWLTQHGYSSRPDLTEWLRPYVEARWKLTAFRLAKQEQKRAELATSAVRMSFKTTKPFFPYSEPADQRVGAGGVRREQRLLRVYLVAASKMEGVLGDGQQAWPGKTVWAGSLPSNKADTGLLAELKLSADVAAPQAAWLTEFEDRSSPRPGITDVYFRKAADGAEVERPPIYHDVYHDAYHDVYEEVTTEPFRGTLVWIVVLVVGFIVGIGYLLTRGKRSGAGP